jgi:hypothetical protein
MSGDVAATELAELDESTDPATLLNVIEQLVTELRTVREQLAQARDEINRLKGEQGRPGGLKKKKRVDQSSERARASLPRRGTSTRNCRRS